MPFLAGIRIAASGRSPFIFSKQAQHSLSSSQQMGTGASHNLSDEAIEALKTLPEHIQREIAAAAEAACSIVSARCLIACTFCSRRTSESESGLGAFLLRTGSESRGLRPVAVRWRPPRPRPKARPRRLPCHKSSLLLYPSCAPASSPLLE